jgi:hypothetical protein
MNHDRLKRAADSAALFLVAGLPQHLAAGGGPSAAWLKALAEHLGVFREIAKRHPATRVSILPHLAAMERFLTSSEFLYFCLRNPKLFRLWASLLTDFGFFFEYMSKPYSQFIESFPTRELIDVEAADFRRLDAADICLRNSTSDAEVSRLFNDSLAGCSLIGREYPVQMFDTSFVYYVAHFAFYASRWGETDKDFTGEFYHNLSAAGRWARSVGDADLVSEYIVAVLHSGGDAEFDELLEFIMGRQEADGAIRREPPRFNAEPLSYEQARHTTLVGLWAISEYAHQAGIELRLPLEAATPDDDFAIPFECDEEEMTELENLISTYTGIATRDISTHEQDKAIQAAELIRGLRPFLCGEHYLRNLEDTLPEIPRELSLPRALMKALLEAVGGSLCNECSRGLIHAMRTVVNIRLQDASAAEWDRLYKVTESILALPIIQEKAAPG